MICRELRIGNLVYWDIPQKIGVPHEVIGIREHRIQTVPISLGDGIDSYLPITLTEEWLLKFGFENEIIKPSIKHCAYFSKHYNDCKYSFSFAEFRNDWGFYHSYTDAGNEDDNNRFDFISCGVKYVHQLQNLIFALTGEELTLKQ